MPTYDYECSECGYQEEVFQKFSEDPLVTCTSCGETSFRRVMLQPPLAFIKGEPNTIGQLADRNRKKMGTYELQDREQSDNMEEYMAGKEERNTRNKINKMTDAQKRRYIERGD